MTSFFAQRILIVGVAVDLNAGVINKAGHTDSKLVGCVHIDVLSPIANFGIDVEIEATVEAPNEWRGAAALARAVDWVVATVRIRGCGYAKLSFDSVCGRLEH